MAKDKGSEFVDHLILQLWIVIRQVFPELLEEFAFSALLAFEAQANQRSDRFAYANV